MQYYNYNFQKFSNDIKIIHQTSFRTNKTTKEEAWIECLKSENMKLFGLESENFCV